MFSCCFALGSRQCLARAAADSIPNPSMHTYIHTYIYIYVYVCNGAEGRYSCSSAGFAPIWRHFRELRSEGLGEVRAESVRQREISTQTFQNPLIKEYTLLHIRDPINSGINLKF